MSFGQDLNISGLDSEGIPGMMPYPGAIPEGYEWIPGYGLNQIGVQLPGALPADGGSMLGQDDSYDYNNYEWTVPTDTGTDQYVTDQTGTEFTGPQQPANYDQESIDALNQALADAQNSGDTQSAQQIESQLNQMEQQIAGAPGTQSTPEESFLSKLLGASAGSLPSIGSGTTTPKAPIINVLPSGAQTSTAGLFGGSTGLMLLGIGILAAFMLTNRKG
jgi:hypothetical protein